MFTASWMRDHLEYRPVFQPLQRGAVKQPEHVAPLGLLPSFSRSSAPTSLLLSRSLFVVFRKYDSGHSGLLTDPLCRTERERLCNSKSCASSGSLSMSFAERQRLKSLGEGERGRGTSRGSWMNRRGWLGTNGMLREGVITFWVFAPDCGSRRLCNWWVFICSSTSHRVRL